MPLPLLEYSRRRLEFAPGKGDGAPSRAERRGNAAHDAHEQGEAESECE